MALEITKYIDVDFYDKKYILVNAKQYDSNSRVIAINCYNQGELMNLSDSKHSAYVRYKKADGNPVLNSCRINYKGQVLVELTEQMLAANGICYVDLIIVNKGDALVNTNTGAILAIDDTSILSTMAFYVNAYEAAVANSEYESSYEFDALNDLMQRAEADYREVMLTSKSWAVGKTGIRDGEDTDNSKYYSKLSSQSASASDESAVNAANSEKLAEEYMNNSLTYSQDSQSYMDSAKSHMESALQSATNALQSEKNSKASETNASASEATTKSYMETTDGYMKTTENYMNAVNGHMTTTQEYMNTTEGYMNTTDGYMNTTEGYMNTVDGYMGKTEEYMNTTDGYMGATSGYMETTQGYMDTAKSHMDNAETYMNNAKTSMDNAKISETNAAASEANTKASEENAATSESNAYDYSVISQRYAVGGTGTVTDEDVDNAKYYYQQVKGIQDSISGTLSPQGTISFEELATVEKFTGYMYLIDESFTTDATFTDGEGVQYPAGTLVFYTSNGLWSCLDSFGSSVATVDEVVEYLGLLM